MEEEGFERFRNAGRVWRSAQWFSSMQDLLGNINTARLNRPMCRTTERCDVHANLKFVLKSVHLSINNPPEYYPELFACEILLNYSETCENFLINISFGLNFIQIIHGLKLIDWSFDFRKKLYYDESFKGVERRKCGFFFFFSLSKGRVTSNAHSLSSSRDLTRTPVHRPQFVNVCELMARMAFYEPFYLRLCYS